VELLDFQMPSDAPDGQGIIFKATTALTNLRSEPVIFCPSMRSHGRTVVRSSLRWEPSSSTLRTMACTSARALKPTRPSCVLLLTVALRLCKRESQFHGPNNITLDGILIPHNGSASDLAKVSTLFTQYLNSELSNVTATGVSTLQNDGSEISWLSEGLQALLLNVPFIPATPINPIQAISIGDFDLAFTAPTAWAPVSNTKTVTAQMRTYYDALSGDCGLFNASRPFVGSFRTSVWI
jgi:hypothetical protein